METHGIRDDMAVLIAMVQRLDGNVAGLVNEVRASHSRYARLEQRVRTLEGRVPQEQG